MGMASMSRRMPAVMIRGIAVLTAVLTLAGTAYADAPTSEPEHATRPSKHGKRRGARFSGRLATAAEMRDTPLEKPSGHIELYAVNFRENLEVDLYDEAGNLDEEA